MGMGYDEEEEGEQKKMEMGSFVQEACTRSIVYSPSFHSALSPCLSQDSAEEGGLMGRRVIEE